MVVWLTSGHEDFGGDGARIEVILAQERGHLDFSVRLHPTGNGLLNKLFEACPTTLLLKKVFRHAPHGIKASEI